MITNYVYLRLTWIQFLFWNIYELCTFLWSIVVHRVASYVVDRVIVVGVDAYNDYTHEPEKAVEDSVLQEYRDLPRVVSVETSTECDENGWLVVDTNLGPT